MIISGLDEAALGPSLGPFCACRTDFRLTDSSIDRNANLYSMLMPAIGPDSAQDDGITIGDSKILYSSGKDISALENGVLAFWQCAGLELPISLKKAIACFSPPEDLEGLEAVPWYEGIDRFTLPWSDKYRMTTEGSFNWSRSAAAPTHSVVESLARRLSEQGLSATLPQCRVVAAANFNRYIDVGKGKSVALQSILAPLLTQWLAESPSDCGRLTVDRQGGRRYYGEWLAALMPGAALRAERETPEVSRYRVGNRSILFQVKADAAWMETALASMTAKYLRESLMILFNQWWTARVSGLRPTAGYPQDAKRFLSDLTVAGALPADCDLLIRKR